MRIDVLSIFPEYLDPLRHALLGKAMEKGILEVAVHDLRQWTTDVHQGVDDTPFGGGPGMVMKPTVWGPALDDVAALTGPVADAGLLSSATPHKFGVNPTAREAAGSAEPGAGAEEGAAGAMPASARDEGVDTRPLLIVPTPAGRVFDQAMAHRWAEEERVVFACGRYEGIDQRVFEDAAERYRVEEVSIGDYVLIGGEVAVLVMVEAMVRLIPGVLGNAASHEEDSFQDGLLEGPSYTRPREWRGLEVPEVLLSGNHRLIERWRRDESLRRTAQRRPDLLHHVELDAVDQAVIDAAQQGRDSRAT